jgi:hypothetical protein
MLWIDPSSSDETISNPSCIAMSRTRSPCVKSERFCGSVIRRDVLGGLIHEYEKGQVGRERIFEGLLQRLKQDAS